MYNSALLLTERRKYIRIGRQIGLSVDLPTIRGNEMDDVHCNEVQKHRIFLCEYSPSMLKCFGV